MNLFGVFVIIYSIAICSGQPVENRYARESASQALRDSILQYRLKNFPAAPQYMTQVIDYPGGVYSGQNAAVTPSPAINQQSNYQQYQQYQQYQPIQMIQSFPTIPTIQSAPAIKTAPAIPITTTTTQLPIIVNEPEPIEEEIPISIPAPIPVPAVRAPVRRVHVRPQPQQQPLPSAANRFRGQDFIDEDILPEDNVPAVAKEETEEERLLREEQAKSAHYSFGTSIDDRINDHSIHRQETRDGLALHGMYSYSDGFFRRTIHYEADENGYRVVKEEIEPIGDGPQFDPNGTADVSANLHNNQLNYSITADDFVRERQNKTAIATGRQHL